jgi:hypothetical protein
MCLPSIWNRTEAEADRKNDRVLKQRDSQATEWSRSESGTVLKPAAASTPRRPDSANDRPEEGESEHVRNVITA